MHGTKYTTKEAILKRAQELRGIPLGEIDTKGRLNSAKGSIAHLIEESWFGYPPNNEPEPDFPEAGVEAKVTPFHQKGGTLKAKERLVCNMIDYMTEYDKTFYTSKFWHKCAMMLIMFYEHFYDRPKGEFFIKEAILYNFPEEDRPIFEQDWDKIMSKVRDGQAHLISEGDTLYLGACTKGVDGTSTACQPFSDIEAKTRAYSIKASYMTRLLNKFVFGNDEDERIIKDWRQLSEKTFEDIILEKFAPFWGKSQDELKVLLGITSTAKNINERLIAKMLGIRGRIAYAEEFQRANIIPKTIRVQRNGSIKESMSFPAFEFKEIIEEEWEDSTLRNMIEPIKFLFLVFEEQEDGQYTFNCAKFWNIPVEDLAEVKKVWENTVDVLRKGVILSRNSKCVKNNLPKSRENRVAHIRPHSNRSFYVFEDGTTFGSGDISDTSELPDGRRMTKQCFWLNRRYIKSIIEK